MQIQKKNNKRKLILMLSCSIWW